MDYGTGQAGDFGVSSNRLHLVISKVEELVNDKLSSAKADGFVGSHGPFASVAQSFSAVGEASLGKFSEDMYERNLSVFRQDRCLCLSRNRAKS